MELWGYGAMGPWGYGAMGLWGYGAMGLWGYGAIIHSIYRMTMPSLVLL